MYPEALDQNMLLLCEKMEFLKELSFYLSGGTGLALQIGHRKSFDLDFFTYREFSPEEIAFLIKKHNLSLKGEMRSHGTLHCVLEGVKTSFIWCDAKLIFPLLEFKKLHIADWRDIAVEKLRTVADRGQRKDFYDLYFGIQKLGIENVITLAYKKFGKKVNYFHLLKGITYFEDAEKYPEPILLDKTVEWKNVKDFFIIHIHDFEKALQNIS